jgi:hypothetical protein
MMRKTLMVMESMVSIKRRRKNEDMGKSNKKNIPRLFWKYRIRLWVKRNISERLPFIR